MNTQTSQLLDLFNIITQALIPSSRMIITKYNLENDKYYYFDTNDQITNKVPSDGIRIKSEFYIRHDVIYFRDASCVFNFFGVNIPTFNKLFMIYGIKIEESDMIIKNPRIYYGYNDNLIKMMYALQVVNPWELKPLANPIDTIRLIRITYTDIQCRLNLLEKHWHKNISLIYDQIQYLENELIRKIST